MHILDDIFATANTASFYEDVKDAVIRADCRHISEDLHVMSVVLTDNGVIVFLVSAVAPLAFYLVSRKRTGVMVVDTYDQTNKTVIKPSKD